MPLSLIKRLVLGRKIKPSEEDNNMTLIENAINGFEAELAVSLNPDGTLKANSVATTAIQDRAVTLAKLAFLSSFYAVDAGAANAMSISFTPAAAAYADGMVFWVKVVATNTGASTLNVDGLGATLVKKPDAGALSDVAAGNLVVGGVYCFVYVGPNFICINPTPVVNFTPMTQEVLDNLGANYPFPATGAALTIPHSFGVVPKWVRVVAVNVTPVNGYQANDEVAIETFTADGTNTEVDWAAFTVSADANNITVAKTGSYDNIYYNAKTGGVVAIAGGNMANWKLKAYAMNG